MWHKFRGNNWEWSRTYLEKNLSVLPRETFLSCVFMTVGIVNKLMPFLILLLPSYFLTRTSLLNHIGNEPQLIIICFKFEKVMTH